MAQSMQTTDMTGQYLNERDQAVQKISKDIQNVNIISRELNTLVHQQAEMVDDLDAHIDTADAAVEDGVQQLEQAATHATSARKKKMILAVICTILGLVLLATVIGYFTAAKNSMTLIIVIIIVVVILLGVGVYMVKTKIGNMSFFAARAAATAGEVV